MPTSMNNPFFLRSKKVHHKKAANNEVGFTAIEVVLIVVALLILVGIIFATINRGN